MPPRLHRYTLALVVLALVAACAPPPSARAPRPPQPLPPAAANAWVEAQLRQLSLKQKVAQLFTVWTTGYYRSTDNPAYQRLVHLVEDFGLGGVIFSVGDPLAQALLANDLQHRAEVPLLMAQDAEWGVAMRVEHTTTFPRAMAVGATRNPDFAYAVGYATAREARALGVHQLYAPVADVNNNPANPIINVRSFGEQPKLVANMVTAFLHGAQDGHALATVKHFPGHGDTSVDSHLALPVLPFERERLDTLELVPFQAAIQAGVKSVMTAHLALPALEPDPNVPASLSPIITSDLLREDLDFDELVVTDALDMQGVTEHFGVGEAAIRALEAGADMLLMSPNPWAARRAILNAIEAGRLTEARIDRSVQRILEAKAWLGLPEDRFVDLEAVPERVGTRAHRVLSETIARQSLTLLRNEDDLLPLVPPEQPRILAVTLSDSDDPDVGNAFNDYLEQLAFADALVTRRLDLEDPSEAFEAVLDEAEAYDVVIVPAFLRVRAWSGHIGLPEVHRAFLDELIRSGPPVVLASFGNPYLAGSLERQPDVYLAAYGPGIVSQKAAAQAIFGKSPTPGRLPVSIPSTYAYGEGMTLRQVAPRRGAPEAVGMGSHKLSRVDSLMRVSIASHAFPGAAVAIGRGDVVTQLEGYGFFTYETHTPVTPHSLFDLASLTKVIATTTAAMLLYEEGKLDLDAPVARYLPAFAQNGKDDVTVWHLLTHSSGLQPYLSPKRYDLDTREDVIDALAALELQYTPGTQTVYSGVGFVTLRFIIAEITGQSLAAYCEEHIFEPLGMTHTGFRPLAWADTSIFVPTSDGAHVYQGVVHDPMARAMGGVSGGAGLFSTAEDLATFAYMLTHEGRIYGRQFLERETIQLFTESAGIPESTRALGWDTRSLEGYSSAGDLFGPESFGHTGFTGTSIWIDPEQDLFAILLTNRVYPEGGENKQHIAIRPKFANLVYRAIEGPPEPLVPVLEKRTVQTAR